MAQARVKSARAPGAKPVKIAKVVRGADLAKTPRVSAKSGARRKVDVEAEKRRVLEIIRILKREYPEARCSLNYRNAFQLLIATILSAQCTDERVNLVTPALFVRFPDAQAMSEAKLPEIEKLIQSTGFYKNKALSLKECSRALVELHGGNVPDRLDDLVKLRGVGRKTANVVLGNIFGIPGVVVDTHVGRLSRRLGLSRETDPVKVEFDVMGLVPQKDWTQFNHLLIDHGRKICTARRAFCEDCPIAAFCPKIGV